MDCSGSPMTLRHFALSRPRSFDSAASGKAWLFFSESPSNQWSLFSFAISTWPPSVIFPPSRQPGLAGRLKGLFQSTINSRGVTVGCMYLTSCIAMRSRVNCSKDSVFSASKITIFFFLTSPPSPLVPNGKRGPNDDHPAFSEHPLWTANVHF